MARGKEALSAANARLRAAHDHIDKLTESLTDAKIRARDAEARAARLEGIEKLIESASQRHDEMLAELFEANRRWKELAKRDGARRKAAIRELFVKLWADLELPVNGPVEDRRQFFATRYPAILEALHPADSFRTGPYAEDVDRTQPLPVLGSQFTGSERRLSGDKLKRFQRLVGHRAIMEGHPDKDMADIWADVLDARQVGFTLEETLEAVLGDKP